MPQAYFTVDNGEQLWKTDGTAGGTVMVANLASSPVTVNAFAYLDGLLFFEVSSSGPTALWRSDGTSAGTFSVSQSAGLQLAAVGTQVFLEFSQQLATVDGATIGPTLATSVVEPFDIGNQLLFFVLGGGGANAVWTTDGTVAGTHMVAPPITGSFEGVMAVDNKLFFTTDDPTNGWALNVSGGAATGVTTLKTFPANVGVNFGDAMFNSGGKLYFTANDGTHGVQLWVSDGTAAGTTMLTDLAPSVHLGSQASEFTTVDGRVIFTATADGTNFEVFSTDGTAAGAVQLTSSGIVPMSTGFFGGGFTVLAGGAYFSDGISLYVTDGTQSGTHMVANEPVNAGNIGEVVGELVFGGGPGSEPALFLSNGTPQGTTQIAAGAVLGGFAEVAGKLYFNFEPNGAGVSERWVSDGTASGTHQFDGLAGGPLDRLGSDLLIVENGTPWITDGTVAGTHQLANVSIGGSEPTFAVLNGPTRASFNNDGVSDFLIQNGAGAVVVGEAGDGFTGSGPGAAYTTVAGLGPEWSFHGEGNFFGDGHGFLIENGAGAVDVGDVADGHTVYTQVTGLGPEWSFRGVGDYLGKGFDQFLIENTAGAVVVGDWMGGQVQFAQVAALGPEWKFVGNGDFLGDGRDDFLIQNTAGAVAFGEVINGAAAYTNAVGLGPEWKFVGTGDFLGEGHSQFLIENTGGSIDIGDWANGQVHFTQVAGLGAEWKFVGAGDYLGEGHDQFLIENSAGAIDVGDWLAGQIHFTQIAGLGPEWAFH